MNTVNIMPTRDDIHRELGMGDYGPIMKEIREIKASINREANYNVYEIAKRCEGLTPEIAMQRIQARMVA